MLYSSSIAKFRNFYKKRLGLCAPRKYHETGLSFPLGQ